jgi:hypothetical protein
LHREKRRRETPPDLNLALGAKMKVCLKWQVIRFDHHYLAQNHSRLLSFYDFPVRHPHICWLVTQLCV